MIRNVESTLGVSVGVSLTSIFLRRKPLLLWLHGMLLSGSGSGCSLSSDALSLQPRTRRCNRRRGSMQKSCSRRSTWHAATRARCTCVLGYEKNERGGKVCRCAPTEHFLHSIFLIACDIMEKPPTLSALAAPQPSHLVASWATTTTININTTTTTTIYY